MSVSLGLDSSGSARKVGRSLRFCFLIEIKIIDFQLFEL